MKKLLAFISCMLIVVMMVSAFAGNGISDVGNHFNLNIIGVDNPKTDKENGFGGNTIFVLLGDEEVTETTRIKLINSEGDDPMRIEGADFAVIDGNGTDGEAMFQLPPPGYDAYILDGTLEEDELPDTAYNVWIRPLGKPGTKDEFGDPISGFADIATCAELVDSGLRDFIESKKIGKIIDYYAIGNDVDGVAYISVEQVGQEITFRERGKRTFTDVTGELTSVVLEVTVTYTDLTTESFLIRVPLFNPIMENYYWKYDNNGLKLLQVRFYPVEVEE